MITRYFITTFCALTFLSCHSSDYANVSLALPTNSSASIPIYAKPAEGFINGRAWQFASGSSSLFERNGKTFLEIKLWDQSFADPCSELIGSPYKVRLFTLYKVELEKVDSSDPFNLIPTILFSDNIDTASFRNNMMANNGLIHIANINNARIVGAVEGSFISEITGRTEISGNFDVPFCAHKSASN